MKPTSWIGLTLLLIGLSGSGFSSAAARAAEVEPVSDDAWAALEPLLRKREYGSASSLLEALAEDPSDAWTASRIEADRKAVFGLQELEKKVRKSMEGLPAGASLKANGIEYEFVRRESDATGSRYIVKAVDSSNERALSLVELSSKTWIALAGDGVKALENQPLVLAVFLGFDRDPDREAARRLFNEAAAAGEKRLTQWLVRLEASAARKGRGDEDAAQAATPLIGEWSVAVGKRSSGKRFGAEFKPGGRVDIRDSRWEQDGAARYRITFRDGPTATVTVAGNVFWGKFGNGTKIVGVRKATR